MACREFEYFVQTWDQAATGTAGMLRAIPTHQYDFRPDAGGRSLGELGWHLAEVDAYMSHGIVQKAFRFDDKPAGITRPKTVEELAPGYERVHREARERLGSLTMEDLDRTLVFFDQSKITVRDVLWKMLLAHGVHHRGQLMLMVRLAGGTPPPVMGPTREVMEAMRAQAQR